MNIDLFHTGHNEAGLVCDGSFARPVIGVILDAQTHELTLEFEDGQTFHLNIPVETGHKEKMLFAHRMYVGYLADGLLTDSFEVPLLYLNDPYGGEFGQNSPLSKPKRSVLAFEQFMKRCQFAQGLHRDNLGDEDTARSVLRGINPPALKYSPALQRQMQNRHAATPHIASGPQSPSPGGGASRTHVQRKTDKPEEE